MNFLNKNIIVLGAGISGIGVAKLCKKLGANVALSDTKPEEKIKFDLQELKNCGVTLLLGKPQEESMLDNLDYLIVSPGVPIGIEIIQKAKMRNIEVMSEIEVAYRLSKAPIYAITGTNGKTTTTALLGELMGLLGHKVAVGGNIGMALSAQAASVGKEDVVVAEISSYQLEGISKFKPKVAAILNLTPDHLARHGSIENYQNVKESIFSNQDINDYLVLNFDDEKVQSMAKRAKGKVMFFSRLTQLAEGAFVENQQLVVVWNGVKYEICSIDALKIKGGHNVENALAAVAIAFLAGVKPVDMIRVLSSFPGVEHRIEPICTIDGVQYYNDSKATNPESAIKALESFAGHIILIAGGHDKNTDLTEFMQLIKQKVDALILFGAAAARFKKVAIENGIDNIHESGYSMEDAVMAAYRLAKPPQVVLLSPACASFDMYDGFEERGRVFKRLVCNLK